MEHSGLDISARVKLQYEEYPYPDYSRYIPLRTQEAYASHSIFSARLSQEKGHFPPNLRDKNARILIAGSGDVLPFVLSFWEPESHQIHAVDLSERNIKRARMRSVFRPHAFYWQAGNLEDKNFALPANLAHVDSYGVLHHLANPAQTLERLSSHMLPGATMRVMVYNKDARQWIHNLQRAFALLNLSAFERKDLDRALAILKRLSVISPLFKERLAPMKTSIFHHSSRFVDTFFHAREARLSLSFWLNSFSNAGLETLGLFDRYAELDDLPNPLLSFPSERQLTDRTMDRRFENNFEIFLRKKGPSSSVGTVSKTTEFPTRWRLKMPPKAWFSYTETNSIPLSTRFALWGTFLKTLEGRSSGTNLDTIAKNLKPESLQRLARLGAIFPSNFQSRDLQDLIHKPIHPEMDSPVFANAADLQLDKELKHLLEESLRANGRSQELLSQVYKRLEAAQKP